MENQQSNAFTEATAPVEIAEIQFRPGQKVYFFSPNGFKLHAGDHVIIETARGPEFGYCTGGNRKIAQKEVVAPLRPVLRMATAQDEKTHQTNLETERKAFQFCLRKIQEMELDMQLVSAECSFDATKLLFFFTADERVDFRDLVKTLASNFHTRIELRQIGVRDKAKMVGGLGTCGRPFCCASFLSDFQPVSIKMAKTQNLSLNPTKISGTCGRLMCCLKYEQDAYEDLIRNCPKAESFVDTPDGRGTVVDIDLLRQRVKVKMEDSPETITYYSNEDIAVLRNGKAKKTDPPIPADLAPISGGGKRKSKDTENGRMFLDPIKFRYSEETIAEEQTLETPEEETQETAKRNNRRRNRKPRTERPEKPESQASEQPVKPEPKPKKPRQDKKPEKKPAPQEKKAPEAQPSDAPKPEGEAKKHRKPYYRRRKPKAE